MSAYPFPGGISNANADLGHCQNLFGNGCLADDMFSSTNTAHLLLPLGDDEDEALTLQPPTASTTANPAERSTAPAVATTLGNQTTDETGGSSSLPGGTCPAGMVMIPQAQLAAMLAAQQEMLVQSHLNQQATNSIIHSTISGGYYYHPVTGMILGSAPPPGGNPSHGVPTMIVPSNNTANHRRSNSNSCSNNGYLQRMVSGGFTRTPIDDPMSSNNQYNNNVSMETNRSPSRAPDNASSAASAFMSPDDAATSLPKVFDPPSSPQPTSRGLQPSTSGSVANNTTGVGYHDHKSYQSQSSTYTTVEMTPAVQGFTEGGGAPSENNKTAGTAAVAWSNSFLSAVATPHYPGATGMADAQPRQLFGEPSSSDNFAKPLMSGDAPQQGSINKMPPRLPSPSLSSNKGGTASSSTSNNLVNNNTSNGNDDSLRSNLFVCGLHPTVDDDALLEVFSAFGFIESAKVMLDIHKGNSRCIAFVKFASATCAASALEALNGSFTLGNPITVRVANSRAAYLPGNPTNKTFVRNVPPTVSKAALMAYFSRFGTVTDVSIHFDTAQTSYRGHFNHIPTSNTAGDGEGSGGTTPQTQPVDGTEAVPAGSGGHEKMNIVFVTFSTKEAAARAAEETHTRMPFPECRGVPLLAKVAEDSARRVERLARRYKPHNSNSSSDNNSKAAPPPPPPLSVNAATPLMHPFFSANSFTAAAAAFQQQRGLLGTGDDAAVAAAMYLGNPAFAFPGGGMMPPVANAGATNSANPAAAAAALLAAGYYPPMMIPYGMPATMLPIAPPQAEASPNSNRNANMKATKGSPKSSDAPDQQQPRGGNNAQYYLVMNGDPLHS